MFIWFFTALTKTAAALMSIVFFMENVLLSYCSIAFSSSLKAI